MADPQILNLSGVEIEIRVKRGLDSPITCTFKDDAGAIINISNYDATLRVTDRAGGTEKYMDTNVPADHFNAAGGQTRFMIPRTIYTGLTGQRPYTWKYEIVLRERTVDQKYAAFFGDFRVLAPNTVV